MLLFQFTKFSIILWLSVFPVTLFAQQRNLADEQFCKAEKEKLNYNIQVPDSLLRIHYSLHNYYYYPGLGAIPRAELPEGWEFDVDAFLYRYATLPLSETHQDITYYYDDYVIHLDKEGKQRELERMKRAAKQYKSRRLEKEARYLDAFMIYRSDWTKEIERGWEVVRQFEKEGERILAIRLKFDLLRKANAGFDDHYYQGFLLAGELLGDLEKVTEEEFPQKRSVYGEIGHLYYSFRDYETAVPLLEKTLTDKSLYFFDKSNLRARNTLALYYNSIDSLEMSEYYYRSMLESPDTVNLRAMFDAIALANLGHVVAEAGNCLDAMKMYEDALPVSIEVHDHNFAAGILIGMGNCYLSLGEMEKTRQIIDTVLVWLHSDDHSKVYVNQHKYRILYPLIGRYHLCQGNIDAFKRYTDSTAIAEKNYENVFNARVILKAQQEIFEAEKKARDEKIRVSRNYLVGLVVILILVVTIAVIMILNSRRLRRKNYSLFERLKEQDMQAKEINRLRTLLHERPPVVENSNGKKKNGDDLYTRLSELMETPEVYSDTKLTRKSLADKLYTNESYLRETIMQRTGLTVTEYITSIRLTRARQLLLCTDRKYTAQEIVNECGFGGVSTFYRLFKNYYCMTPEQFRNSADKK
ncbi:MAG: helix-turn-helix domain-containing protein [Bacteroidales bacterium]|jgi:AraC-like DNA-binding protein|nr:helix-turn-helix domain-containing protein [Bacteroidales bacterium]